MNALKLEQRGKREREKKTPLSTYLKNSRRSQRPQSSLVRPWRIGGEVATDVVDVTAHKMSKAMRHEHGSEASRDHVIQIAS